MRVRVLISSFYEMSLTQVCGVSVRLQLTAMGFFSQELFDCSQRESHRWTPEGLTSSGISFSLAVHLFVAMSGGCRVGRVPQIATIAVLYETC